MSERAADIRRALPVTTDLHRRLDGRRFAVRPRYSSISAADRIAPTGFATFFPAYGGADPCTGSNIDVRPGMQIAGRRHAQTALQLRRPDP